MAEPVRYYFDQHYPSAVAKALRHRGINVLTAQEAGRCSARRHRLVPDDEVFHRPAYLHARRTPRCSRPG